MTEPNFWEKAISATTVPQEDPEPISPEDVELVDWEGNRGALGIRNSGDFIGVDAWQRPERIIHYELSALEIYAAEREALGVREAPQASAGNPRKNASAWRAV